MGKLLLIHLFTLRKRRLRPPEYDVKEDPTLWIVFHYTHELHTTFPLSKGGLCAAGPFNFAIRNNVVEPFVYTFPPILLSEKGRRRRTLEQCGLACDPQPPSLSHTHHPPPSNLVVSNFSPLQRDISHPHRFCLSPLRCVKYNGSGHTLSWNGKMHPPKPVTEVFVQETARWFPSSTGVQVFRITWYVLSWPRGSPKFSLVGVFTFGTRHVPSPLRSSYLQSQ